MSDDESAAALDSDSDSDGKPESAVHATSTAQSRDWRTRQQALESGARSLLVDAPGSSNHFYLGSTTVGAVATHPIGSHAHAAENAVGTVSNTVLDRIRDCFVPPSRYLHTQKALESQQVIFMRAPEGTGRTTAALRLLNDLCRSGVHRLAPEIALKALPDNTFESGCGYLLEHLDTEQVGALRLFHMDRLAQVMRDRGCLMVIIVDPAAAFPTRELGHLVVDELGDVEPLEFVRKHMNWLNEDDDQDIDGFLAATPVRSLVSDRSAASSMKELADLSALLVDVLSGRMDLTTAAQRNWHRSVEGFAEWFDGLTDSDQRALAIALAVFNGESCHLVSSAATMLAKRLRRVEVPNYKERGRQPFAKPLGVILNEIHATTGIELGVFGDSFVPSRVARYKEPYYAYRVLDRVTHYGEAFDLVLDWLRDLGHIPGNVVRTRAGVAAGYFARTDFITICDRLIGPWAMSGDHDERWAAAAALKIAGEEPGLRAPVAELLEFWSEQRDYENWRLAAALTVGDTAAVSTAQALRLLRGIAGEWSTDSGDENPEWWTPFTVAESICTMITQPDKIAAVLAALRRWAADPLEAQRREAALCAFLMISTRFSNEVDDSEVRWPVLVWIAHFATDLRDDVAALLGMLLNAPGLMAIGYDEILRWVKLAYNKAPELRGPIGSLLTAAGRSGGDVESAHYYIADWASRHPNRKQTAVEILGLDDLEGAKRG